MKKTIITNDFVDGYLNSPFAELSEQLWEYGITTYNYTQDDLNRFKRINTFFSVSWDFTKLHTFIPNFSLDSVNSEYKLVRLNAWQFLTRPNMRNVQSCHHLHMNNSRRGANIAYLDNPFWSCFGLVSNTGKNSSGYNNKPAFLQHSDLSDLPNIVAAFNVLLCVDLHGTPSLFVSRIYGDTYYFGPIIRSHLLKLSELWNVKIVVLNVNSLQRDSELTRKSTVISLPYPSVLGSKKGFYRYHDISERCLYKDTQANYERIRGNVLCEQPTKGDSLLIDTITLRKFNPKLPGRKLLRRQSTGELHLPIHHAVKYSTLTGEIFPNNTRHKETRDAQENLIVNFEDDFKSNACLVYFDAGNLRMVV